MTKARKEFVEALKEFFQDDDNVISAWEGGSAATGYIDEYSDLDLMLIVEDDYIEPFFIKIEKFLKQKYGIKHKLRIPEPSWHGHSQCYYLLNSENEFLYLDLLLQKRNSDKDRFLEQERHGKAFVWFDKENLIKEEHIDKNKYLEKWRKTIEMNEKVFPLLLVDTKKYVKRNRAVDAMDLYNNLLQRLAFLLNIRYRPAQYDFGLRYTFRDFPKRENEFLQKMMYVSSIEQLEKNLDSIKDKFYSLLKVLKQKYKIQEK